MRLVHRHTFINALPKSSPPDCFLNGRLQVPSYFLLQFVVAVTASDGDCYLSNFRPRQCGLFIVILSSTLSLKTVHGTRYIKKVSHRTLIFQVLCCFLLFLLHFCHMALEACFHIFGVKRFDDTNTVVINVDNLIPLAVKIAGG